MNQYFIEIGYYGDRYRYFISAKNQIHALALIRRDWLHSVYEADSIKIVEVMNYEVPEAGA